MSVSGQVLPSSLCPVHPVYGRGKVMPHNKGLSAARSLNTYEFGKSGKRNFHWGKKIDNKIEQKNKIQYMSI